MPAMVITVLVIILYGNTLRLDYALDDYLVITGNAFTKQGIAGIPEILSNDSFTGFFGQQKNLVAGGRYRPLSQVMFAIEYELFGLNPFLSHAINLILYILLGLMTLRMLNRLNLGTGKPWYISLGFLATLLFLAHPIHTEAVANIKGRDEILSMLGSMAAWYFSILYADERKRKWLIWAGISMFLGLMSKENAITFLAVVPLSIYFFRTLKKPGIYILTLIPLLTASVGYLLLRYNALGFFLGGSVQTELLNNPYILASPVEKIATNILTWGLYIKLLILPHPLTHDYYPFHIAYQSFSDPGVLVSLIIILLLIGFSFMLWRKKHILSFAILFIIITFSISSNVVFNIGTFMNERFLFVPSLGFSLALTWILLKLNHKAHKKTTLVGVTTVILLLYSVKTISRNPAWQDDYTLFTTDVAVSSNSIKCLVSAGGKTMERWETLPEDARDMRDIDQAIIWIDKGVRLHPTYFAGWEQLGKAYYLKEDFENAWHCYEQCMLIKPGSQPTLENQILIARAADFRKKTALSARFWALLFERHPQHVNIAMQYADMKAGSGDPRNAMNALKASMEFNPENAKLIGKAGEIWGRYLNRMDSSEVYLRRSIALDPKYTPSLENLGVVCGLTGRSQESLEWLLKAMETDPDNPRILTNIANTYRILGNQEAAATYQARANAANQAGTPEQ